MTNNKSLLRPNSVSQLYALSYSVKMFHIHNFIKVIFKKGFFSILNAKLLSFSRFLSTDDNGN